MPDDPLIYSKLDKVFNRLLSNPGDIFLVSPFTNADAIAKLLSNLSSEQKLTLVTRWRIEDIMSGVSDIEVYKLIKRSKGQCYINNRLHAKYYRKGNHALVGSANLTHNGFSVQKVGNLELLCRVNLENSNYSQFEETILENAILVNDDLYEKMNSLRQDLPPTVKVNTDYEYPSEELNRAAFWWPEIRNPESLWQSYQDDSIRDEIIDLRQLSLPAGIENEKTFRKAVSTALECHSNINKVINYIKISERRFGEMRLYLREIDPNLTDTTIAWQTLFRWLLYSDPARFEYFRPNFTEIIRIRN